MKLSRKCINYSGSTWNFALFSENITPPGKNSATAGRDGRDKFQLYFCSKAPFELKIFASVQGDPLLVRLRVNPAQLLLWIFHHFFASTLLLSVFCWGCNLHGAQRQWHHLLSSRCLRSSFNFPLGDKSPRMITFQRSSNWKISTLIMICERSFFWVF